MVLPGQKTQLSLRFGIRSTSQSGLSDSAGASLKFVRCLTQIRQVPHSNSADASKRRFMELSQFKKGCIDADGELGLFECTRLGASVRKRDISRCPWRALSEPACLMIPPIKLHICGAKLITLTALKDCIEFLRASGKNPPSNALECIAERNRSASGGSVALALIVHRQSNRRAASQSRFQSAPDAQRICTGARGPVAVGGV